VHQRPRVSPFLKLDVIICLLGPPKAQVLKILVPVNSLWLEHPSPMCDPRSTINKCGIEGRVRCVILDPRLISVV